MTTIVGIDPGISGAVALLDTDGWFIHVYDMPIKTMQKAGKNSRMKNRVDALVLFETLAFRDIQAGYIEQVFSSPQMGVVSAFTFGENMGACEAILQVVADEVIPVLPAMWKKALGCTKDKKKTVDRACKLFQCEPDAFQGPQGGLKDGRAEAALIAFYGTLHQNIKPPKQIKVLHIS